jgi:thioredoxin 1/putative thioredoxin
MLSGAPILYCRAGDRTKDAVERLSQREIPLHFLEGGLLSWESAGLELTRPE